MLGESIHSKEIANRLKGLRFLLLIGPIRAIISKGKTDESMPGYEGSLKEEEIRALVTYIRTLAAAKPTL